MTEQPSRRDLEKRIKELEIELKDVQKERDGMQSLLNAFVQGAKDVLELTAFEETARSLFYLCREQIGAKSGYVGLLNDDGSENEVLFLESGGLPCSVDPELPMPVRGLREQVYTLGMPAFDNDFENSEWARYLPEGHVRLKNVLFAPLVHDGATVGLLGLANKPSDFTDNDARIALTFCELSTIALREAHQLDRIKETQSELLYNKEKFRSLFDTMNEGVCLHELLYDDKGRPADYLILDVNPAYEALTGISRTNAVGSKASDLYGTGEAPYLDIYARVAETETPEAFEIFWPAMDRHFLISTVAPVKGQFATVFTDITDQKIKEQQLKISEEYLSTTLSSIGDAVITTDTDGRVVRMNPVAETLTGWPQSEAENRPLETVFRIFNQKTGEPVESPVAKVLRKGGIVGLANHTVLVSRNGEKYFIDDSGAPIKDPRGDIHGVVMIFRDITEKYRTEEALRKSEEQFRLAFHTSPDSVNLNRLEDGLYIDINEGFTRIMGYTRDDVIGKTSIELDIWKDPKDRKRLAAGLSRTGSMENLEAEFVAKDGEIKHGLMSARLMEIHGEKVILSITRDMTEHKRFEAQLRQSQKMESIGSLAGGIAHDFNNILFPVMGMSEMLLEDLPEDSPEYHNAEQIFRAGKRGSDLVKQILAFSRQSENKPVPLRIQDILKEAVQLSRATIPANIEIDLDIPTDCGFVMADPAQIHQVAMNLITNAFHAVNENGGSILVTLREAEPAPSDLKPLSIKPGKYAKLTVSDSGPGIDTAMKDRIFEPYFTTKEKGKGTGLGLSVVYGIIREHAGDIRVHSEPGKGASFDVYLPLMESPSFSKTEDQTTTPLPGGDERVLIVDDEQAIVQMEKKMLDRLGYRTFAHTASKKALDRFRADPHAFDLVLTDMTMPDMTGDLLAAELMKIRPDVSVVICTGFSEKIDRKKAQNAGIKGFLMKPVVLKDLARAVRNALDS